MENSRNKQFINFKLCAVLILSSMMKSLAVWFCPTQGMTHPLVQLSTLYPVPDGQSLGSSLCYQIYCFILQCLYSGNPQQPDAIHHNAYGIHLTSSHHIGIVSSHHHEKSVYSTIGILKRDHIHITFIMVCYHSCSTLLFFFLLISYFA